MSRPKSASLITRALSWTDDARAVKRFFFALIVLGLALTAFDLYYKKKVYFDAEYIFGFYSVVGFLSCLAVVLVGLLMRLLLGRREDFYAPYDTAAEPQPAFDLGVPSDWQAQDNQAPSIGGRTDV